MQRKRGTLWSWNEIRWTWQHQTPISVPGKAGRVLESRRLEPDLVVQKACVVVSIATLLVVLAQVVDQERACKRGSRGSGLRVSGLRVEGRGLRVQS
eukprot:880962-Rhodomonas_salina.4